MTIDIRYRTATAMVASLCAAVALVGCGPASPSPASSGPPTTATVVNCGDISAADGSTQGRSLVTDGQSCLAAALSACRPATLILDGRAADGDRVGYDVVAGARPCHVRVTIIASSGMVPAGVPTPTGPSHVDCSGLDSSFNPTGCSAPS